LLFVVVAACAAPGTPSPDAAVPEDAGALVDAGASLDGGMRDGGAVDAGVDGGVPRDAGVSCPADGGSAFCAGTQWMSCGATGAQLFLECTTPNAFALPYQYDTCATIETGNDGVVIGCAVLPGEPCYSGGTGVFEDGLCAGPGNGCEVFPDGGSRCVTGLTLVNDGIHDVCRDNVFYSVEELSDGDTRQFEVMDCARYGATCTPPSGACVIPRGGRCDTTWMTLCETGSCTATTGTAGVCP
jgi:hypothetical protein